MNSVMLRVLETGESPLLLELSRGNISCAKRLIRDNLELASQRINRQDGYSTVMHSICELADAPTVKALVEVKPDYLCLLRDYERRTLLHTAAVEGKEEVLRVLIILCPKSIRELTSLAETALHIALKNRHWDCFRVLMEHLEKHDPSWMELLNRHDSDGNTVLHFTVLHKHIEILKLLLSYKHRNGDHMVDVNSKNNLDATALDLHYQNISNKEIDIKICYILHEARVKIGRTSSKNCSESDSEVLGISEKKMMKENMELTRKSFSLAMQSLLQALLIFVASSAYQSLFSLTNIYPLERRPGEILTISFIDIIWRPSLLPDVFYAIMTNTLTFLVSIVLIFATFWFMATKWSLGYHAASLVLSVPILVNYGLAAKKIMPNFWITVGPHKIPSFWAMCFLFDLPLVFIGFAAMFLVKLIVNRYFL